MSEPVISKSTLVPLSLVATVIFVLVGGILWLTDIRGIAKANWIRISDIQQDLKDLGDQNERLARIEGKLDVIHEIVKENSKKQNSK